MKPLLRRLNVSQLRHLEGGKDWGREKGERPKERLSWGGREGEAPCEKEIWEKVRMIMPKYRNTECVCVCQRKNNRVVRMKCFSALPCLCWLLFLPDDWQVSAWVCVCVCICAHVWQSHVYASMHAQFPTELTGVPPGVCVLVELFALCWYRDVYRVTARAQGSAYTWELWAFSNVYKTQTVPSTPTGTHVIHRRRRRAETWKDRVKGNSYFTCFLNLIG